MFCKVYRNDGVMERFRGLSLMGGQVRDYG